MVGRKPTDSQHKLTHLQRAEHVMCSICRMAHSGICMQVKQISEIRQVVCTSGSSRQSSSRLSASARLAGSQQAAGSVARGSSAGCSVLARARTCLAQRTVCVTWQTQVSACQSSRSHSAARLRALGGRVGEVPAGYLRAHALQDRCKLLAA